MVMGHSNEKLAEDLAGRKMSPEPNQEPEPPRSCGDWIRPSRRSGTGARSRISSACLEANRPGIIRANPGNCRIAGRIATAVSNKSYT
jgi:hypothetical protein